MSTYFKTEKRKYIMPEIQVVLLDNAISLALASEPDGDPNWTKVIHNFNDDPFHTNMG